MHFSLSLEQKGGSHLPFQGFRFHTEGSSAVVAFELDAVGSGGQRQLSVRGRLQSGVLGENKGKHDAQPSNTCDRSSVLPQALNM